MPYIKITTNKKGKFVARIQVLTKDIKTGKNKLAVKRIHNNENLTEAKFKKYVEKFSLIFEEEVRNAYEEQAEHLKSNVLTFSKLFCKFLNASEICG